MTPVAQFSRSRVSAWPDSAAPQTGLSRSRVVALWKDRFNGATEIELPPENDAVAVSLSTRYREEFTADGRGDDGSAAFPILSGVHPISAAARRK